GAVIVYSEEFIGNRLQFRCGDQVTVRGENAVPAGKPGTGGAGGTLRSALNLAAFANLAAGKAGAAGNFHTGGTLSARRDIYVSTQTIIKNGQEITSTDEEDAPKAPGNNAAAASGQDGAAGSFVLEPNAAAWLHSFAMRSIVQYAKDAYLDDRIAETRALLSEYRDLLQAHERIVAPDQELNDDEFSEK